MILTAIDVIVVTTKMTRTLSLSSVKARLVITVTPQEVKTPSRVMILKIKPQMPMFSTDSGIGHCFKYIIFVQSNLNLKYMLIKASMGAASKQVENIITYPI
mgnify:CR=1 FL=1